MDDVIKTILTTLDNHNETNEKLTSIIELLVKKVDSLELEVDQLKNKKKRNVFGL